MKGKNMKRVGGFLLGSLEALALVFVAKVSWSMGQYYSDELFDAVKWLLSVLVELLA